jgi:hypothetical protein
LKKHFKCEIYAYCADLEKNEFVEGKSNEVLQKVDGKVFSQVNIFNAHFTVDQDPIQSKN